MAEEMVELGFEGVDKFADKYHDRVYDHLPEWKKKILRQEKKDRKNRQDHPQGQQQQQYDQGSHTDQYYRNDSGTEGNRDIGGHGGDRGMSSYAPSGRQEYRDDRDSRYVPDEKPSSRGLNTGAMAMRDPGRSSYEDYQRAPSPLPYGYDPRVEYPDARGRPAPSRMRSSSYSPPREKREKSRRRHRSKSRARSRDGDDGDRTKILGATIVGSLVGGFAGNQSRKGKKYDTAATIAGAILGGMASRELADRVGSKKDSKKDKYAEEEQAWEGKFGKESRDSSEGRYSRDDDRRSGGRDDERRSGGRDDDRKRNRDSRSYYDR